MISNFKKNENLNDILDNLEGYQEYKNSINYFDNKFNSKLNFRVINRLTYQDYLRLKGVEIIDLFLNDKTGVYEVPFGSD